MKQTCCFEGFSTHGHLLKDLQGGKHSSLHSRFLGCFMCFFVTPSSEPHCFCKFSLLPLSLPPFFFFFFFSEKGSSKRAGGMGTLPALPGCCGGSNDRSRRGFAMSFLGSSPPRTSAWDPFLAPWEVKRPSLLKWGA